MWRGLVLAAAMVAARPANAAQINFDFSYISPIAAANKTAAFLVYDSPILTIPKFDTRLGTLTAIKTHYFASTTATYTVPVNDVGVASAQRQFDSVVFLDGVDFGRVGGDAIYEGVNLPLDGFTFDVNLLVGGTNTITDVALLEQATLKPIILPDMTLIRTACRSTPRCMRA